MPLSLIVAVSENDVIGSAGRLPWRLSTDLKRFQKLTMGHHLIMGRKTYESIGRLLPGRNTVILSGQIDLQIPGARVVGSPEQALEIVANDSEPFVVGGAEIYAQFLPWVKRIYLTRVHVVIEGDVFLPTIDWNQWNKVDSQRFKADEKNEFDFSFETYQRSEETRGNSLHQ